MRPSRAIPLAVATALVAALLFLLAGIASRSESRAVRTPALAVGQKLDKPAPAFKLVDERGRHLSLASFRGQYVILVPSLTLCHEVCPMTTAVLQRIQQTLERDGLMDEVALAEVTVDPWRDSPARLRAYRRLTGAKFRLLTGSPAQIRRFWQFFGVYYKRVPQDDPPDRDWWTGKPETFDVEHTDGFFLLDPRGHLRVLDLGMPSVAGRLAAALRRLLNEQGERNLHHPAQPWNSAQVLDDLFSLKQHDDTAGTTPRDTHEPSPRAARAELSSSPPVLAALHTESGALLSGGAAAFKARLRTLRGHPVVINEWASWCPPCRNEFPLFARASTRFGTEVAFLGLNVSDETGSAERFLHQHPVSYPSYRDPGSAIASSFGTAQALPITIYLTRNGDTAHIHIGYYVSQAALESDIERYALTA
jgi:cytochrome oxidase Cu insertion factor (SCO1/SenC/PrrC family)/thiol-disulfide isomerase/thioredoxin